MHENVINKKALFEAIGLGQQVERVEKGNCPLCGKAVHPNNEFRDELSRREYKISGMCQKCQDDFFGNEDNK